MFPKKICVFLIFCLSTSFAFATQFKSSYSELLFSSNDNAYQREFRELAPNCLEKVRAFIRSGSSLRYEGLVTLLQKLDSYKRLHPEYEKKFFHWTKSKQVLACAEENNLIPQFDYIRGDREGIGYLWRSNFFVSDDARSSKIYGDQLISLEISGDANVLNADIISNEESFRFREWIFSDLAEISTCFNRVLSRDLRRSFEGNPVMGLIMEASGVDMVDFGSNDLGIAPDGRRVFPGKPNDFQFFFIINPFVIVQINKE